MSYIVDQSRWLIVTVFFAVFLFFLDTHDFGLWTQVIELRGASLTAFNPFTSVHYLRYALVFPVFYFSDLLLIDQEFLFTFVCFLCLIKLTQNCSSLTEYYLGNNRFLIAIYFTFLFVGVSAFMNGRIIFSFLGYSYLLVAIHKWEYSHLSNIKFLGYITLALFFMSVSTGTFLSGIIFLMSWFVLSFNRNKGRMYFYLIPFILLISPIVVSYFMKNVIYYGGGISGTISMLQHGAGIVFYMFDFNVLFFIFCNMVVVGILGIALYYSNKRYRLLLLPVGTGLCCGFFGYSTLTLVLIPAFVLFFILCMQCLFNLFPKRSITKAMLPIYMVN